MGDDNASGLRADARENRARILETARQAFAEHGLSASLENIARQAGVGVGTLYRRFPTRERLIGAAFAEKMREYADAAEHALTHEDSWEGFCAFIETSGRRPGIRRPHDARRAGSQGTPGRPCPRARRVRRTDSAGQGFASTARGLRGRRPGDASDGNLRCAGRHRRRGARDVGAIGGLHVAGIRNRGGGAIATCAFASANVSGDDAHVVRPRERPTPQVIGRISALAGPEATRAGNGRCHGAPGDLSGYADGGSTIRDAAGPDS